MKKKAIETKGIKKLTKAELKLLKGEGLVAQPSPTPAPTPYDEEIYMGVYNRNGIKDAIAD